MKLNLPQNREKIDKYMKELKLYIRASDVISSLTTINLVMAELQVLASDLEEYEILNEKLNNILIEQVLPAFSEIIVDGISIRAETSMDHIQFDFKEGFRVDIDEETRTIGIVNDWQHPQSHSANMIIENEDRVFLTELEKTEFKVAKKGFIHDQIAPEDEWIIEHPLNKKPSVTVVDSAGTVVIGSVTYISEKEIKINFTSAFSGQAYLN